MKIDFLTSNTDVLTPPTRQKRTVIPRSVQNLAEQHWLESTILEPAIMKACKCRNNEEVIPKRLQVCTDNEQYENFRDQFGMEIRNIMKDISEQHLTKLNRKPDSSNKLRLTEYFSNYQEMFPSLSWYLRLKPAEVKQMHDHTTGLCYNCEAAKHNYATLKQVLKTKCDCRTSECDEFVCQCGAVWDPDMVCDCKCDCDSCHNCKVRISSTKCLM